LKANIGRVLITITHCEEVQVKMEDQERIHAEIEARLNRFAKNIDELTTKAKAKEKELPAAHKPAIESVKAKKEVADRKFEELKQTDKNAPHWHSVKAEVDKYVGDVDEGLREALAYF
jgi:chromosome segregation ATPase